MENTESEAGAFGQWALLLAGARRNTRAGREAEETVDGKPDSDEAANASGGPRGGDTLVAGREV